MNAFQNKKKFLSNSEIPGGFNFLTFFEHFYSSFSTLFKQKNPNLPILEVILAVRQLPFQLQPDSQIWFFLPDP